MGKMTALVLVADELLEGDSKRSRNCCSDLTGRSLGAGPTPAARALRAHPLTALADVPRKGVALSQSYSLV